MSNDPNDMDGWAEMIVLIVLFLVVIGAAAILGMIGFGIWWWA